MASSMINIFLTFRKMVLPDDSPLIEFNFSIDQSVLTLFKSFTINACGFLCGFLNTSESVALKTKSTPRRKLPIPKTGSNGKFPRTTSLPTKACGVKAPQLTQPHLESNMDLNCFKEFTSEGEKLYLCNLCSYQSNIKGNIRKHINVKHNENCPKIQCSMCPLQVKVAGQLKIHYMRVHKLPEAVAKSATNDSAQVWNLKLLVQSDTEVWSLKLLAQSVQNFWNSI